MGAQRAIDTSLPDSEEQNPERHGLKMNENVSSAQSNENAVGLGPGTICQLDLFQRPKFNQLDSALPPPALGKDHLLQPSERKRFSF